MDAHLFFRLFVVFCVIWTLYEVYKVMNKEPENRSKSSRDIHINTTKENKEHN